MKNVRSLDTVSMAFESKPLSGYLNGGSGPAPAPDMGKSEFSNMSGSGGGMNQAVPAGTMNNGNQMNLTPFVSPMADMGSSLGFCLANINRY
jgi:hypothetical protein